MILLPVIERELRVAARARRTYRNRFFTALAVIGMLFWILKENSYTSQAAIGGVIFQSITNLSLVFALLAGLFHTADAISEEVREGTLGLLFLTDLRSIHIVLGKLVAHSIPALFALTTILPILAIPILLGGVTYGELARAALVLASALWLSLCAGMLASCLTRDDRGTLLINLFIVLLPTAIAPICGFTSASAFGALDLAHAMNFALRPEEFWTAIAIQTVVPAFLLVLAAIQARRLWRERPRNADSERRAAVWRDWSTGAAEERRAWRMDLLAKNPALWLASRRRVRRALLWAILGAESIGLLWYFAGHGRVDPLIGIGASVLAHWALKTAIAFAACRAFSEEAHSGAFELLFTTDLSAQQLILGHVRGLTRSFGFSVGAVLLVEIWWLLNTPGARSFFGEEEMMWMRTGFLLFDLLTITIYGMSMSLKFEHAGKAAARTLALVILLPNLAIFWFAPRNFTQILFLWTAMDVFLIVRGFLNLVQLRPQEFVPLQANSARE